MGNVGSQESGAANIQEIHVQLSRMRQGLFPTGSCVRVKSILSGF